jgi:hypothetical protein
MYVPRGKQTLLCACQYIVLLLPARTERNLNKEEPAIEHNMMNNTK